MLGRSPAPSSSSPAPLQERASLLHPAVFVLEYALAKLWESVGVRPRALLGYSLGEYTAAHLAGVFSLEDALRLVVDRARLLERLPEGAMLAVPLSEKELEEELEEELGETLSLGAVNAPGVCVVSGAAAPVAALAERLGERGVPCRRLPVSQALHSALMEPILEPFARLFAGVTLRPPKLPYVTGVTGTWVTPEQACSPEHWVRHLRQTVRFSAGIATLWQDPSLALVEIGPGHGLTTLALQHGPGPGGKETGGGRLALPSLRPAYERHDDVAFYLGALGRLWTSGVEVAWPRLHAGERRRKVRLPSYPFERQPYRVERPARGAAPGAAGQTAALAQVIPEPTASVPGPVSETVAVALHPRPALPVAYTAPRSATEEAVAEVWRASLRLQTVGVHDNFFHLGGHSLLASQIALRMEQAFGVELPLRLLLDHPTVAEIAAAVERLRAGEAAPASPELDLRGEVRLDPSIRSIGPMGGGAADPDPDAVLLTGATGFLGAYLLRDLLRETRAAVYCLARAASPGEALERVRASLAGYGLWEEGMAGRIVPVPGDLGQPLWGMGDLAFRDLAGRVGAVYHCGAWVNFTYPYSVLAPVNVQGTHEAIRLAALGPAKPLHFVSTIAVFAPGSFSPEGIGPEGIGLESSDLPATDGLFGGYGQSKWVAEKLLAAARERGLAARVYRPGAIGGDSATGAGNPKDLIWSYLKGCIQLGAVPALDAVFDPAPVDYVSRAIVTLSRKPEPGGEAFHLFNPEPVRWADVFAYARSLGYPLRELPLADWLRELLAALRGSPENALAPFWPLFAAAENPAEPSTESGTEPMPGRQLFDGRNTRAGLAGTAVACPPVAALLATYFAHLIASGFLPAPRIYGLEPSRSAP